MSHDPLADFHQQVLKILDVISPNYIKFCTFKAIFQYFYESQLDELFPECTDDEIIEYLKTIPMIEVLQVCAAGVMLPIPQEQISNEPRRILPKDEVIQRLEEFEKYEMFETVIEYLTLKIATLSLEDLEERLKALRNQKD